MSGSHRIDFTLCTAIARSASARIFYQKSCLGTTLKFFQNFQPQSSSNHHLTLCQLAVLVFPLLSLDDFLSDHSAVGSFGVAGYCALASDTFRANASIYNWHGFGHDRCQKEQMLLAKVNDLKSADIACRCNRLWQLVGLTIHHLHNEWHGSFRRNEQQRFYL